MFLFKSGFRAFGFRAFIGLFDCALRYAKYIYETVINAFHLYIFARKAQTVYDLRVS